jgi:hypothetical protein
MGPNVPVRYAHTQLASRSRTSRLYRHKLFKCCGASFIFGTCSGMQSVWFHPSRHAYSSAHQVDFRSMFGKTLLLTSPAPCGCSNVPFSAQELRTRLILQYLILLCQLIACAIMPRTHIRICETFGKSCLTMASCTIRLATPGVFVNSGSHSAWY